MLLILGLLAAVTVAAVLVCLAFKIVKNWFKENQPIVKKNNDYNVIMKQKYKSGSYKTIAGVFNEKEQKLYSATAWKSDKLDSTLANMDKVEIIYNLN